MTISVIIADDQPLVRAGIAMLLDAETDIDVVGGVSDGAAAIELARSRRPDVVVMDVRMPGMDGVSATRILADDDSPDNVDHLTKVLVLTTFNDDEVVYEALRAGASGFLLKHAAPHDLITAVRKVASGESWIDPAVAGTVIAALAARPPDRRAGHSDARQLVDLLTPREREVLILMAHGLSNADIRDQLVVSEATVKTHVARVVMKTGSRDRTQAVVRAYQSGLVVVTPLPRPQHHRSSSTATTAPPHRGESLS